MATANIKLSVSGGGAAKQEVSALAKAFEQAAGSAKAFGKALPGGGTAMNLLGLAGPMAFAATVGAIVANSIRLAVEFNRISSASTWQMTSNAAQAMNVLRTFQRQAMSLSDLGLSGTAAAQMMAGYGSASGSLAGIGGARPLAMYARAMGQDPNSFAAQMGLIGQNAGNDISRNAGNIMGAASISGDAGRRIPEFIGVATTVLQQIAAGNPGKGNVDIRDALKEVTGFAHLGGYFATTQGLSSSVSAFNKFGGGSMLGNWQAMHIATVAGLSVEDQILGLNTPGKKARFANAAFDTLGGDKNRLNMELFLMNNLGMSGDEARLMMSAHAKNGGKWLDADFKNQSAQAKADAYADSDAGQVAKLAAEIENAQITLGKTLIHEFAPWFAKMAGSLESLVAENGNKIPTILLAILGLLASSVLFKGVGGWIGGLAGAAMKGAPDALRLFAGSGMITPIAAIAATLSMPGSDSASSKAAADRRGWMATRSYLSRFAANSDAGHDILDPSMTTPDLVSALMRSSQDGFNLKLGTLKTGHTKYVDGTNRISDHFVGRAADILKVNGHGITDSEDPTVKAFLMWAMQSGLYDQIGIPRNSAYWKDKDIQREEAADNWRGRHGNILIPDNPGNIHLGVPFGKLEVRYIPDRSHSTKKGGTHRAGSRSGGF